MNLGGKSNGIQLQDEPETIIPVNKWSRIYSEQIYQL